jgi:hypothetical protein
MIGAMRPRPRLEAYVWWCGDEECDCTQPRIELVHGVMGRVDRDPLWVGTFRSGEEGGRTELNQTAKKMRRVWPEAYRRIFWPWTPSDSPHSHGR